MKNLYLQIPLALFLFISVSHAQESNVRWQIKKDNPAIGLTLGYSLPGEQLQTIVGDKFKPLLNKEGKGYLMLFIATCPKYNLDSTIVDSMQIAHILVNVEGSLNNPLVITGDNQTITKIFSDYNFKTDSGELELSRIQKGDSVFVTAGITTSKGSIRLKAAALNNPGEWKKIEAAKISATADPKSFFTGNEAYRPIQIESAIIESVGENWITQLKLPAKPDKIYLSVDFTWDFTFTKE